MDIRCKCCKQNNKMPEETMEELVYKEGFSKSK